MHIQSKSLVGRVCHNKGCCAALVPGEWRLVGRTSATGPMRHAPGLLVLRQAGPRGLHLLPLLVHVLHFAGLIMRLVLAGPYYTGKKGVSSGSRMPCCSATAGRGRTQACNVTQIGWQYWTAKRRESHHMSCSAAHREKRVRAYGSARAAFSTPSMPHACREAAARNAEWTGARYDAGQSSAHIAHP